MQGPPGAETILNGRRYLYFAGTGYLGLQGHPEVIAAAIAALQTYGIHSATTRTGFGTTPLLREVEERASAFLGVEDALYLSTGYAGNSAIVAAIKERVAIVLIDELAHDSLQEGVHSLDGLDLPPIYFRHRDPAHVKEMIAQHARPGLPVLLMTDGVFAVSGKLAPLADYLEVLRDTPDSLLLVDDAHGLGVIGEHGRGSLENAGVEPRMVNRDPEECLASEPMIFHSAVLSKAVGGHGGVIAGSKRFLERVRQSSGWFRAASAPASAMAAATAKGLAIISSDSSLRHQLAKNVAMLRNGLRELGLDVEMTSSPIIGLSLGSAEEMARIHQRLLDEGIAIAFSRDYVGCGANGTLRIAVFATHTPMMINRLLDSIRRATNTNV